jgi:hypothetical protein
MAKKLGPYLKNILASLADMQSDALANKPAPKAKKVAVCFESTRNFTVNYLSSP